MKKIFAFLLSLFLVSLLIGCPPRTVICPQPDGNKVTIPKCEQLIKYNAGNVTLPSISFAIPSTGATVTVGGTTWKRDKLHDATTLAANLDLLNYKKCQNIPSRLSVCRTKDECHGVIADYDNLLTIAGQYILIMDAKDPKALDRWLKVYASYKKTITKGVGGKEVTTTDITLKENVKALPIETFKISKNK